MTAVQHTPGPWVALDNMVCRDPQIDGRCIANADKHDFGIDASIANARLIAAAPDLLAALNAIVARIRGEYDQPDLVKFGPLSTDAETDCKDIARAAIAKATGK